MSRKAALLVALPLIILSSAGIVTFLSAQEGSAPMRTQRGGSLEAAFFPDRVYRGSGAVVYRVSRENGVLVSSDGGETWAPRNAGLPQRAVYPFTRRKPPIITSFAVDPSNGARIALTLPGGIYLSEDAGQSWAKVEAGRPLTPNDELTSIALDPLHPSTLAVGTSFHGFFETTDKGATWKDLSEKMGFLSFGAGYSEEVASLAYYPPDPSIVFFSLGYGKGLYWTRSGSGSATQVRFPGPQASDPIADIRFTRDSGPWMLEARTDTARWSLGPFQNDPEWRLTELLGAKIPPDAARIVRIAKASGKYGVYVTSYRAGEEYLGRSIDFIKANSLNSMVVDFKDDEGTIAYDTRLEKPRTLGAVEERFSADALLRAAHENGIYVIARIPVFKDRYLYDADGHAYAVWDRVSGGPWQYRSEFWVDPYCPAVWKYTIDIARELQERGVDEIQFDYIRFPSDGDISRASYRFRKEGMGKVEALESFLSMAREAISIPISADVYGDFGWSRISEGVAQDIGTFSRYVDVISPMFYPSHFAGNFLASMEYRERAGYIYREGSDRAARIVGGRSVIRPWVQAFRLGRETSFSDEMSASYLLSQAEGALEGASSGFVFWNASNDYYMVPQPLGRYLPGVLAQAALSGGK
jgi:hypothetical protein